MVFYTFYLGTIQTNLLFQNEITLISNCLSINPDHRFSAFDLLTKINILKNDEFSKENFKKKNDIIDLLIKKNIEKDQIINLLKSKII
jgi:flagella basal body P-ring formation protein FlgA